MSLFSPDLHLLPSIVDAENTGISEQAFEGEGG